MSALTGDYLKTEPSAAERSSWRAILRALLALDPAQASFATRGFPQTDAARRGRLEKVGETFIAGFNCALGHDIVAADAAMADIDGEFRGFAVEGAAMAYGLIDALTPRSARLGGWLERAGPRYTYLIHVGAGWTMARMPWRRRAILKLLDPVHHWLAFDGLGFHDGYFKTSAVASGWRRVGHGYAARAYDQGVGRALWFMAGGDGERAAQMIARFDGSRHSDVWSGLGLAVTYAGAPDVAALRRLVDAAGGERWSLAQGAAFAAAAHAEADCLPAHTAEAVRHLADCDAATAVQIVRDARAALPPAETAAAPRYELWRCAVREALKNGGGSNHA